MNVAAERKLLLLLALIQFTVIMDFMVMMPLGPLIIGAFHISPVGFAAAVSTYSWCSGLSGLLAATYIDRFDRRSLLLTTYTLFAISNLACAYAGTLSVLLVARAFAGLMGGVITSLIMAIVGDVIPAQRRGAAMGTVMTAFSLATVMGVPVGIVIASHFGWNAAFVQLFGLTVIIGLTGFFVVPSLKSHVSAERGSVRRALPDLWRVVSSPRHRYAFPAMFIMMFSQMLVVQFIPTVLVDNHGVPPLQLSWLYIAGGIAPYFTAPLVGRMADRFGPRIVFRVMLVFSLAPILFLTHLPQIPYLGIALVFPVFMVAVTGRMVPLQALLMAVPKSAARGAFVSVNSSFQALGGGCGAWFGGLLLFSLPDGRITGYGTNGWLAAGLALLVALFVGRVRMDADLAVGGERVQTT